MPLLVVPSSPLCHCFTVFVFPLFHLQARKSLICQSWCIQPQSHSTCLSHSTLDTAEASGFARSRPRSLFNTSTPFYKSSWTARPQSWFLRLVTLSIFVLNPVHESLLACGAIHAIVNMNMFSSNSFTSQQFAPRCRTLNMFASIRSVLTSN